MMAKMTSAFKGKGEIGGAPAMIIIALSIALIVAIFLWRDYAASNAKSPNYASPGQVLPGGLTVQGLRSSPGNKVDH